MMHPRHLIALVSALACGLCPAQTPHFLEHTRLQASAIWAENLSRTSHEPTQKSAGMYEVSASAENPRQLSRDWLVLTGGEISARHVPRYDGLDHFGGGASVRLRQKFGLGAFAPVLEYHAALHGEAARETGRSGWRPAVGLEFSQRLTETWHFSAGAGWTRFMARHEPFDVTNRRLRLESSYDLTEHWQVTLGGNRIWGEFTANAAGAVWAQAIAGGLGPTIFNHYNTLAWETSGTFGPGWVAYRIRDSRADQWWLELAPALTADTALALRYEFVKVINAIGIRYDSAFWTLSLLHRF
jgi:hypothetical protein